MIYFCHGAPGGPSDAQLLADMPDGVEVITPNLFENLNTERDIADQTLVQFDNLTSQHGGADICLMGFSMGALAACHIAARRPNKVSHLTLISAAAPLELGHFLPDMAGAPVFLLAKQRPKMLRALTWAQGVLTKIAPGYLLKRMFLGSDPSEIALLETTTFQTKIREGLRNSFTKQPGNYAAFLAAYTKPWGQVLADIQCPTKMWHGAEDIWAPPAMADALKEALPGEVTLTTLPNTGHYGALQQAKLAPATV